MKGALCRQRSSTVASLNFVKLETGKASEILSISAKTTVKSRSIHRRIVCAQTIRRKFPSNHYHCIGSGQFAVDTTT